MSDIALQRRIIEALELGRDLARAEAEQVHKALAGYLPRKHAAADAQVVVFESALADVAALRAVQAAPPAVPSQDARDAARTEWNRGYYCAVALLLKRDGAVTTDVSELFHAGGDPSLAEGCDRSVFIEHGLLAAAPTQPGEPG